MWGGGGGEGGGGDVCVQIVHIWHTTGLMCIFQLALRELTTHILAGDGEGGPRFHHPSIHNHTYNDGVTGVEDTVGEDAQPAGEHGNVLVLLTLLLS